MATLHALGALAVFATLGAGAAALAIAALRGGARWAEAARIAVTVAIGLEMAVGLVLLATGDRPREPLHYLYAIAALAALPLAASFAAEAPPRPRAWVLAIGCGIGLLLLWRLASTG